MSKQNKPHHHHHQQRQQHQQPQQPPPPPIQQPPPQPIQQPPPIQHYQQQYEYERRKRSRGGRTNLASCAVATIFLIFVTIVILIVFFTIFKPKDPLISVNAVTLPSFSLSNNSVNFTFSQYVSVKNPNRADFSHYDSSLQLLYSGSQVGFMFIPAGVISAGRTTYMAATFSVSSFPLSSSPDSALNLPYSSSLPAAGGYGTGRVGPTMEMESRVQMVGRVRVLHFFTHHVESNSACRVAVSVTDGSVLGFHC